MGKVRTRILGLEDLEKQQIEEQKKRSAEKKAGRDTSDDHSDDAPKKAKAVEEAPSRKPKVRGKKYQSAAQQVDAKKEYAVEDAVAVLKKIKFSKFDESVELHLNVDEKNIKGEIAMPHTTGKTVRVKIVDDALLDQIEKGNLDFDVLIAHPSYMPKLAKFARVLGPKGLMPNPKAGTVSPNPEQVVSKFESGTLQWKSESKFPLIHQMVAKISLEDKAIVENVRAFIGSVGRKRVQAAFIKTSMSPSLKLDLKTLE